MNIKVIKKRIKDKNPIFESRPNLCYLPWIHLEASSIGEIKPCCMAEGPILDTKTGLPMELTTDTLLDAYHSAFMSKLRLAMLSGKKPDICKKCWDEEESDIVSKRLMYADHYSNKQELNGIFTTPLRDSNLIFLDLKLGNICNLRCRICGPMSSSKWVKDEYDRDVKFHNFTGSKKDHGAYIYSQKGNWPRDNKEFWSELKTLLPQITHLEFTGGEPWMIKEQFDLLEFAVQEGYADNIYVHYNTNGTQYSQHALDNIWPHFKGINISVSVDDIEKKFEYQRKDAKWKEVNENIANLCKNKTPNTNIEICTTVSILNIMSLIDVSHWVSSIEGLDSWYLNLMHQPSYFSVTTVKPEYKPMIKEMLLSDDVDWDICDRLYSDKSAGVVRTEIEAIVNHMLTTPKIEMQDELVQEIDKMDEVRGEKLIDVDPKLDKIIR
jgi:organic radical activating enzyme